ncbi:MAG: purple acid phosphatase family protein [Candidatus Helarchaeota archaeon]
MVDRSQVWLGFKKWLIFCLLLGGLIGTLFLPTLGPWIWDPHLKRPYLSFTGDPRYSIGITFETPVACNTTIYYGTSITNLNNSQTELVAKTLHFFNLTNLHANTTYYYLINSTNVEYNFMNKVEWFRTAPEPGLTPFKFVVIGDSRTDSFGNCRHSDLVPLMVQETPNIVLNVGDIVGGPTREDNWDRFFYEIHPLAKNVPYMVAIGNHELYEWGGEADQGQTYRFYMNYPGNEMYYSYQYGNALFLAIDTSDLTHLTQEQIEWVNHTLAMANASGVINWIFPYFHRPAYSAGGNNQEIIDALVPLFEKYRVDIVFMGHDHHYERMNVSGITYIITGGGGAELDWLIGSTPWTEFYANTYQFCSVTVNGYHLTFNCIDSRGRIIDSFQLTAWRNIP